MIYRSTCPSTRASTHPCTPPIHPPTYHYVLMFSSPELHKDRDLFTAESWCLHRADAEAWPSLSPFLGSVAACSFTIAIHALHSMHPKDTHILFLVAPAKVSQLAFSARPGWHVPWIQWLGPAPYRPQGLPEGKEQNPGGIRNCYQTKGDNNTNPFSLVSLLQPFRKRSRKCIDTDTLRAVRIHMWQTLQWNKQEKSTTTRATPFTKDFFFRKCSRCLFSFSLWSPKSSSCQYTFLNLIKMVYY